MIPISRVYFPKATKQPYFREIIGSSLQRRLSLSFLDLIVQIIFFMDYKYSNYPPK